MCFCTFKLHSGAQWIRSRREAAPAQIPLSLSKAREMYTLQCLAQKTIDFNSQNWNFLATGAPRISQKFDKLGGLGADMAYPKPWN